MTSILNTIKEYKLAEVAQAKARVSAHDFVFPTLPRDFIAALRQKNPAIIAEIKKASPSKGIIREDFDVATIAGIYENYGATCLSVLTDEHFFHGQSDYVAKAKAHCSLPVLRKDFIVDSYQIEQSRALEADCILLIVALLDDSQLMDFCQQAQALSMAVLVESHNADELRRALKLPTPLIGINNRSLHTFITDINTSINLATMIPDDKIIITESGINTRADMLLMIDKGINTFLIGESLMRSPDIGLKLNELLGTQS